MSSEQVKTALDTASQRPLEMEQDGRRARQHSLRDIIAAHRYLQSLETEVPTTSADGYMNMGVRTCRIEPGGSA